MTTQLDTNGPGIEDYRSSRFTVSVNGSAQYVYGYERAAAFTTSAWTYLDVFELSWVKFGADESVTVSIALADLTPITTATVYPKSVALNESIVGGVLTLTVPTNKRLFVEVNGERAEGLVIDAQPLKATVPAVKHEFFTDLGKGVASVDSATDRVTFGSAHGLTSGDRIVFNIRSGGAFPTGLSEMTVYEAVVVSTTVIELLTLEGDAVDITSDSATNLYANAFGHSDTVNALYFPAGRYAIGLNFPIASNVDVYLDRGAIVVGSFAYANTTGITWRGPGQMSGEHTTYEEGLLMAYQDRVGLAPFNGYGTTGYSTNSVQGITCFAMPFFMCTGGITSFTNASGISPWTPNTDGFVVGPSDSVTKACSITDCFGYFGDDALHMEGGALNRTARGCFIINSAAACVHGGYWPVAAEGVGTNVVDDCDFMHMHYQPDDSFIFRVWTDGWLHESTLGYFNATFSNCRVWGPMAVYLFNLQNKLYPWGADVRQAAGQIAEVTFSGISVEVAPADLSLIYGLDTVNTPHDLTFTDLTIAGTLVHQNNYTTYFDINSYPYALTWDAEPVTPETGEIVVETGAGSSLANSYASVAQADSYFLGLSNPATWTGSTTAQKEAALRIATAYLDDRYGMRWRGSVATTTQALDWPRGNAYDKRGLLISSTAIPTALMQATCEVALRVRAGTDLVADLEAGDSGVGSTSITVGPITLNDSYLGAKTTQPTFTVVEQKLRGLLTGSGSMVGLSR